MSGEYEGGGNHFSNIIFHDGRYQLVQTMYGGGDGEEYINMIRDVKNVLEAERDDVQVMLEERKSNGGHR